MDFSYTPQEEAFREELRAWLEANLPAGYDPDEFEELAEADERFDWQLAWHKKMYAGGWVGIHWPKAYGGRGATLIEQMIFQDEMQRVRAPSPVNILGLLLVGPTLMHWGTPAQRERFLPKILSAEEIWCQGYSEPGAGSDLAALQTRALEDGDDFIVNGQKVWTSLAHRAHWCILVTRTDPSAPKHRGLTYLLVDMRSPGITIRPLVQITGDAGFNEVFFEDVRVPKRNIVGAQNNGWQVAVTTLMFERAGLGSDLRFESVVDQLVSLAQRVRINGTVAWDDSAVRQKLAQLAIEAAALKYNRFRQITRQLRGEPPGPEGSIAKLSSSELNLRVANFAAELLGPYGPLVRDSWGAVDNGKWAQGVLGSRAMTIAGGTSEIQRNIIGERVLHLPKR
ncbi:MAG: acyl-CoA dehydrogenase [Candidatus Binatia bacterium]